MLVCSTLNPAYLSSLHLLVIHYNDERVLVPVDPYAKYSELHAFIANEWALENQKFSIETNELSICPGSWVRIHEEAWIGVKDIVGYIHVRVHRSETTTTTDQSKTHHRASSVKDEMKHEDVLTSRAPSESADEDEVEQQTKAEIHRYEYTEETPTARKLDQNSKQEENAPKEVPPRSPKKPKPQGDTLNLFGDEQDADSPNEENQKEEQNQEPASATAQKPTWRSIFGTRNKSSPSITPDSASTTSTLVTPTPGPRSGGTRAKGDTAQPSSDHAASEDPERVLIVVEPPADSIYEARGFRIRREHTVRTVLKGACKAFKIDYTKARLRMVAEVDESGDLVTVRCDDMNTMNSLNVEDNQRFVIEMADEDEEGVEESN